MSSLQLRAVRLLFAATVTFAPQLSRAGGHAGAQAPLAALPSSSQNTVANGSTIRLGPVGGSQRGANSPGFNGNSNSNTNSLNQNQNRNQFQNQNQFNQNQQNNQNSGSASGGTGSQGSSGSSSGGGAPPYKPGGAGASQYNLEFANKDREANAKQPDLLKGQKEYLTALSTKMSEPDPDFSSTLNSLQGRIPSSMGSGKTGDKFQELFDVTSQLRAADRQMLKLQVEANLPSKPLGPQVPVQQPIVTVGQSVDRSIASAAARNSGSGGDPLSTASLPTGDAKTPNVIPGRPPTPNL